MYPHPIPGHQSSDKSWGKGIWINQHLLAAWSDTFEKTAYFCQQIRFICANLPCKECTDHAMVYIDRNPPEKAEDPFIWMWEFHNSVNASLGKPLMPYEECRDLYYGGKIKQCATCGGTAPVKVEKVKGVFNSYK